MIDIKLVRDKPDFIKEICEQKNEKIDIDRLLILDESRRRLQSEISDVNMKRNDIAKKKDIEAWRKLKWELTKLEEELRPINDEYLTLLKSVPNIPSEDTPIWKSEEENVILKKVWEIPKFTFKPKDHYDLWVMNWFIDNEAASKVSWSRFTYLKSDLVLLQFAIVTYTIELLTNEDLLARIIKENNLKVSSKPFIPVLPPVLMREDVMWKMARLEPKDERYHTPADNLYLVWSAEHTLWPIHMWEIINESDLPLRYAWYSTSFRREAWTYWKDMKGILRVHQFDKVEMETFSLPEDSIEEQKFLVAIQEHLVSSLNLPYQIVLCCTGDMWWPDARHLDVEVWLPWQNKYRETHSADLMTDYQSRRLNTRLKRSDGKKEFVHMNDATAFALWRTMIAIMENYQNEDGSISVPEILIPYLWWRKILGGK